MTERLWLIYFGDTARRAWWANFLRPGFRHVWAASWYADQERWVLFEPAINRTVISLYTAEQWPARLAVLLAHSSAVLRVASRAGRGRQPTFPWCVGAIKSLLGVRSWALTPWQLYRSLRGLGADVVESPCVVAETEAAAPCRP